MSWKDELERKLQSPEQQHAEAERKKREQHAEGARATSQGLAEIRRALFDLQNMLGRKYGSSVNVSYSSGDDSTLEFPGHKLSARRSDNGTGVVLTADGKDMLFAYKSNGTFAADDLVACDIRDFSDIVGKLVTAMVGR